jgi:hypothetical protein
MLPLRSTEAYQVACGAASATGVSNFKNTPSVEMSSSYRAKAGKASQDTIRNYIIRQSKI